MATWIDGGGLPPRSGYYAEEAERAMERSRGRPPSQAGVAQAAGMEAAAYASLEVAAAIERLTMELAALDAGPLGRDR